MGKNIPADSVFRAWTSGDLSKMVRELETDTNPIERHFLLLNIEELAYKERKTDPEKRELFRHVAETHIAEFPVLARALRKDMKSSGGEGLPSVPTFKKYATVLTEDGEYEKAISVCKKAISHGLRDGTKAGWEGRMERIRKKMEKQR
jgi:hypothetical protein